jgi:arginase
MIKTKIIEVASELGAGTRGASLGPAAVKIASLKRESSLFSERETVIVETQNHLLFKENKFPNAIRIDGIVKVYEAVVEAIATTIKTKIPVVLAGDHSTAGGTIAGIKKTYPDKRLGVIWIDAHADLHSPYTTPSGNVHGMPLAAALNEDNKEFQINDLEATSSFHWEALKNMGGMAPKVNFNDLVFIGVRDTEAPENGLIARENMANIRVEEVREKGTLAAVKKALDLLEPCDHIYISLDVDVLDSSLSVGTGTPVPKGLWVNEVEEIIKELLAQEKVACFEMVEVNPLLDTSNKMAEMAYGFFAIAVDVLENR